MPPFPPPSSVSDEGMRSITTIVHCFKRGVVLSLLLLVTSFFVPSGCSATPEPSPALCDSLLSVLSSSSIAMPLDGNIIVKNPFNHFLPITTLCASATATDLLNASLPRISSNDFNATEQSMLVHISDIKIGFLPIGFSVKSSIARTSFDASLTQFDQDGKELTKSNDSLNNNPNNNNTTDLKIYTALRFRYSVQWEIVVGGVIASVIGYTGDIPPVPIEELIEVSSSKLRITVDLSADAVPLGFTCYTPLHWSVYLETMDSEGVPSAFPFIAWDPDLTNGVSPAVMLNAHRLTLPLTASQRELLSMTQRLVDNSARLNTYLTAASASSPALKTTFRGVFLPVSSIPRLDDYLPNRKEKDKHKGSDPTVSVAAWIGDLVLPAVVPKEGTVPRVYHGLYTAVRIVYNSSLSRPVGKSMVPTFQRLSKEVGGVRCKSIPVQPPSIGGNLAVAVYVDEVSAHILDASASSRASSICLPKNSSTDFGVLGMTISTRRPQMLDLPVSLLSNDKRSLIGALKAADPVSSGKLWAHFPATASRFLSPLIPDADSHSFRDPAAGAPADQLWTTNRFDIFGASGGGTVIADHAMLSLSFGQRYMKHLFQQMKQEIIEKFNDFDSLLRAAIDEVLSGSIVERLVRNYYDIHQSTNACPHMTLLGLISYVVESIPALRLVAIPSNETSSTAPRLRIGALFHVNGTLQDLLSKDSSFLPTLKNSIHEAIGAKQTMPADKEIQSGISDASFRGTLNAVFQLSIPSNVITAATSVRGHSVEISNSPSANNDNEQENDVANQPIALLLNQTIGPNRFYKAKVVINSVSPTSCFQWSYDPHSQNKPSVRPCAIHKLDEADSKPSLSSLSISATCYPETDIPLRLTPDFTENDLQYKTVITNNQPCTMNIFAQKSSTDSTVAVQVFDVPMLIAGIDEVTQSLAGCDSATGCQISLPVNSLEIRISVSFGQNSQQYTLNVQRKCVNGFVPTPDALACTVDLRLVHLSLTGKGSAYFNVPLTPEFNGVSSLQTYVASVVTKENLSVFLKLKLSDTASVAIPSIVPKATQNGDSLTLTNSASVQAEWTSGEVKVPYGKSGIRLEIVISYASFQSKYFINVLAGCPGGYGVYPKESGNAMECQPCPEDTFSAGTFERCADCPEGSTSTMVSGSLSCDPTDIIDLDCMTDSEENCISACSRSANNGNPNTASDLDGQHHRLFNIDRKRTGDSTSTHSFGSLAFTGDKAEKSFSQWTVSELAPLRICDGTNTRRNPDAASTIIREYCHKKTLGLRDEWSKNPNGAWSVQMNEKLLQVAAVDFNRITARWDVYAEIFRHFFYSDGRDRADEARVGKFWDLIMSAAVEHYQSPETPNRLVVYSELHLPVNRPKSRFPLLMFDTDAGGTQTHQLAKGTEIAIRAFTAAKNNGMTDDDFLPLLKVYSAEASAYFSIVGVDSKRLVEEVILGGLPSLTDVSLPWEQWTLPQPSLLEIFDPTTEVTEILLPYVKYLRIARIIGEATQWADNLYQAVIITLCLRDLLLRSNNLDANAAGHTAAIRVYAAVLYYLGRETKKQISAAVAFENAGKAIRSRTGDPVSLLWKAYKGYDMPDTVANDVSKTLNTDLNVVDLFPLPQISVISALAYRICRKFDKPDGIDSSKSGAIIAAALPRVFRSLLAGPLNSAGIIKCVTDVVQIVEFSFTKPTKPIDKPNADAATSRSNIISDKLRSDLIGIQQIDWFYLNWFHAVANEIAKNCAKEASVAVYVSVKSIEARPMSYAEAFTYAVVKGAVEMGKQYISESANQGEYPDQDAIVGVITALFFIRKDVHTSSLDHARKALSKQALNEVAYLSYRVDQSRLSGPDQPSLAGGRVEFIVSSDRPVSRLLKAVPLFLVELKWCLSSGGENCRDDPVNMDQSVAQTQLELMAEYYEISRDKDLNIDFFLPLCGVLADLQWAQIICLRGREEESGADINKAKFSGTCNLNSVTDRSRWFRIYDANPEQVMDAKERFPELELFLYHLHDYLITNAHQVNSHDPEVCNTLWDLDTSA